MTQKQVYDENIHELEGKIVRKDDPSHKLAFATLDVTAGPGNVNVNAFPHYHVIEVGSPQNPGYGSEHQGATATFKLPADIKRVDIGFPEGDIEGNDITLTFYDAGGKELKKVKNPTGRIGCESGDKVIDTFEVIAVKSWASIQSLKYST